jgi:Leu/Phe-tRNA-protein transferase
MKLRKTGIDKWRVEDTGFTFEGDIDSVMQTMLDTLSIEFEEISAAIACMGQLNHDTAHFGYMRGIFTHTSSSRAVENVKTELKAIVSLRTELFANRDMATFERLQAIYQAFNAEAALDAIEGKVGTA